MALSIAVGFVVDDAVGEIENMGRHIEEVLAPYDAAMKGSGEIGFTVMAITFSLIAVFIPLFLMSGYVGLLFREFAMTVSVALVLSLVISRTLTPMMCAYLLKPEKKEHGWLYRLSERGFDGLLHLYEAGLKIVLRHQFITLYMQPAQDITIGARLNKTQFQYTLNDADPGELAHWSALFLDKIKAVPGITDVATDQLNAGPMLDITIKRDVASSYGILPYTIDNTLDDAFGQRIVSTIYTTLQQYHVILEVNPKFQYGPEALNGIYVKSSSGQQVPLSTLVDSVVKVAPLVINHQGQFPSVTISFNLAPGTAIGQAVSGIQAAEKELHPPLSLQTSFQGSAQAFGASLRSTPILIAAPLFVIYLILGVLYESVIHPITIISTLPSAGLGALLLLMAVHYVLNVIAIVGIILLIGIVKKNGIMLVDFAQQVEHSEGLTAEAPIYRACLLPFRPLLMTTMAALLGGVPMMLGTGVGSELRQPLGYAIVGGLALSQILTLYTTPVIYIYLNRLQSWLFQGRRTETLSGHAAPVPAE